MGKTHGSVLYNADVVATLVRPYLKQVGKDEWSMKDVPLVLIAGDRIHMSGVWKGLELILTMRGYKFNEAEGKSRLARCGRR